MIAIIGMLLGCSVPTPEPAEGILSTEMCGVVQVDWVGEPTPPPSSPRYGTTHLKMTWPDGSERTWRPSGTLHFSDWDFEACAPSGAWIVLPRDRFCPLDVVAVPELVAWLDGQAKPTAILHDGYNGVAALVCGDIRWIGPDTLRWEAGGETPIVQQRDLSAVP